MNETTTLKSAASELSKEVHFANLFSNTFISNSFISDLKILNQIRTNAWGSNYCSSFSMFVRSIFSRQCVQIMTRQRKL